MGSRQSPIYKDWLADKAPLNTAVLAIKQSMASRQSPIKNLAMPRDLADKATLKQSLELADKAPLNTAVLTH